MYYKYLIILLIASSLVFAQSRRNNSCEVFQNHMRQEIISGNVLLGEGEEGGDHPWGIQGYTNWPDTSYAEWTWVKAIAVDDEDIQKWAHTTWTIGWDYYVHSTLQPQPIPTNHKYYLKGLHWVPTNHSDYPTPGSNPSPPEWAEGMIESHTYISDLYEYAYQQIFIDIYLDGDAQLW